MTKSSKLVGFVATANPDKSNLFYASQLGLTLREDTPFALVFVSDDTIIRVQKVEMVAAAPYTVLGWEVDDIAETVKNLKKQGVQFENYDALEQDELGIWNVPDGTKVAWFKDPDGNLLSIAESAT